ncbi:hypothetical protein [Cupriavidus alkaliphilus]|uniref:hypothetical protein n=1 Tax=Cupriavidus alkaliphilus TaxID=942866 RepID=UPI0015EC48C4|nr:hypothetical protein [Cupriavidus alkaliphilus]
MDGVGKKVGRQKVERQKVERQKVERQKVERDKASAAGLYLTADEVCQQTPELY